MHEVHASRRFDAAPDTVFAALSEHAAFLSGAGLRCRLLREGGTSRNGVGAVREVNAGALVFVEEVVAFEPPHRYDYVIRSLTWRGGRALPVRHQRGWVECMADGGGTQVDWRSRFELALPVLGPLLAPVVAARVRAGFAQLLARAARRTAAAHA